MKAYLYEIENLLTGEKEIGITKNKFNIWAEYLEKGKRKVNPNSIGAFMLTQETDENISIKILEEDVNLRNIYTTKAQLNPILSHGNIILDNKSILEYMNSFGFLLDGKERLVKNEILGFCEYLKEVYNIKVNWNMIKKVLMENNNLTIKRSHGNTFYIINR